MFKLNLSLFMIAMVVVSAVGFYTWKLSQLISQELPSVEIQRYWGENFSSLKNFWRNSMNESTGIGPEKYLLVVNGLVAKPGRYTYEQLLKFPEVKKHVTFHGIEGWTARILWEGFLVNDVLDKVGVNPRAKRVVFYGTDGYTTSLPLEFIRNKKIMMAYRMNGMNLSAGRGFPFHLVAEKRWGNKWLKSITRIELSDSDKCQGYYGSWGDFNNVALNEDF